MESFKKRINDLFDRGLDSWDIYDMMGGLVAHNEIEACIEMHDEFGPLEDFGEFEGDFDDESGLASAGWGVDESYE